MNQQQPPGPGPTDPHGAAPPPPPQNWPPENPPPLPPWPAYPYPAPMAPPPPPRPARSFTRAIFLTLATTIFGVSLLVNLYLLLWLVFSGAGDSARSNVLLEGDPRQTLAVLPVTGMITGETFEQFDKLLRQVEANPDVKALILEIDTPGGEVTASDEIHHRLMRYRRDHPGIPVISSMRQLATSGGYYIACATDHIIAQPSTMTGNVGVLMMRFNVSQLMDKWGIQDATLHSTGADFKDAGSMFKPESPQERAYIQQLLDEAFAQFKNVVRAARADKLTVPLEQAANGKVYMAATALELGLIDQIGYAEQAYAYAAQKAGNLDRIHVVRYQSPQGLLKMLGVESRLNAPAGVHLNLDAQTLRPLLSPRMMYLWQTP